MKIKVDMLNLRNKFEDFCELIENEPYGKKKRQWWNIVDINLRRFGCKSGDILYCNGQLYQIYRWRGQLRYRKYNRKIHNK